MAYSLQNTFIKDSNEKEGNRYMITRYLNTYFRAYPKLHFQSGSGSMVVRPPRQTIVNTSFATGQCCSDPGLRFIQNSHSQIVDDTITAERHWVLRLAIPIKTLYTMMHLFSTFPHICNRGQYITTHTAGRS